MTARIVPARAAARWLVCDRCGADQEDTAAALRPQWLRLTQFDVDRVNPSDRPTQFADLCPACRAGLAEFVAGAEPMPWSASGLAAG